MIIEIEGFRLSPQQSRFWSIRQNLSAYKTQIAILIDGILDKGVLNEALCQVVNRHDILHTTFHQPTDLSMPIQAIAEVSTLSCQNIDLNDLSCREQEEKVDWLFHEHGLHRFDYARGPLLRSTLLTLSPIRHILLISLPPLCADSWTLKNIIAEVARSYAACLRGEDVFDEVTQYVQFSEWQNELVEDQDADTGKRYWDKQNLTSVASLSLSAEPPIDRKPTFDPRSVSYLIEPDRVSHINAVAGEHDVSADVLLLSCWQVLLWQLTRQARIVISNLFDGRKYEELHEGLGLFAKWLPVHCELEEGLRFADVLNKTQQSLRNAYTWQEYFQGNDDSQMEDANSAFISPFAFEFDLWPSKYRVEDVIFSCYKRQVCFEQFEIKLSCTYRDESLIADFCYDAALFSPEDIQRLAGQFLVLLTGAVESPHAFIGELPILTDVERQQLLVEFNSTETDYPRSKCAHELFEEQAARAPDRVAAIDGEQFLTYAELNGQANKLARYLKSIGVGPEVFVAIYNERSLDTVIAVLGILKAGGAFLPLDIAHPKERIAFILEDAAAPVILTQTRLAAALPDYGAKVICLDSERESIASQSGLDLEEKPDPQNLAYAIYTSGSTGKPKGVLISQRSLVNYISWSSRAYSAEKGSEAPVHTPMSFDLTITSLFPPLLAGTSVTIIPDSESIDSLASYLQAASDLSIVKITPSHLEALNHLLPAEKARGLVRTLVVGGEALSWNHLSYWLESAPNTKIINEYGPTESVVGCCIYEAKPDGLSGRVPIGRPIANTQLFLLNDYLQPMPVGVAGELYIGGDGLARGYLNRPDLTATSFIPNSFGRAPGARLYKTGDLARHLAEGNIDYIGRVDHQVKIRGFRVEPGEIEAVLRSHTSVKECAIVAEDNPQGSKTLVAYITCNRNANLSAIELRRFLQEKLPAYMVPTAYVVLDALPLTPNGKVDHKALALLDHAELRLKESYIGPRDSLELQINGIWENLLNISQISMTDSFFDVGGDSILALHLMARIQKMFQIDLALTTLLESPNIESLASIIREHTFSSLCSPLVTIQGRASARPFFCMHPSGGGVLCYAELARHLGPDQSFYGLQEPGLYGESPYIRFEDKAAFYIDAMRTVQAEGPYYLGGYSLGGVLAFEVARQLVAAGDGVALLALLDTRAPLERNKPLDFSSEGLLLQLATELARVYKKDLSLSFDELTGLGLDEQLDYTIERMKGADLIARDAGPEQMRRFLTISIANTQALKDYVPQVYPGKITLFRAEERSPADPVSMEAMLGWDELSSEPIELYFTLGSHESMMAAPDVRSLAEKLKSCIEKAEMQRQ